MNRVILFFITSLIALMIGWGVGGYITYNKTIETVGKIPASPIIVKSYYDKEKHAVIFSFFNPGTLPLNVVSQSFVFKPGKESKEKSYQVENIPVNIPLIPLGITAVALKLKKGTEELKNGDVIMATIYYTHPLSKDVYSIAHRFEYGIKKNSPSNKK